MKIVDIENMDNHSPTRAKLSLIDRGSCPLCGSERKKKYISFPQMPIVQCQKCDFIHSNYVMSEETLKAYYKNDFGGERHIKGQQINALVNTIACDRLLNFSSIKTCLDVGTGYGFLLKSLKSKYDLEETGLELSIQEVQYANQKLGLNVMPGLLAEAGLEPESFDLAMCFEVIEHVEKPIKFIQELARYVKPGGFLLVMTDNFKSSVVKRLGPEFPKWIPHTHISHFSPETLEKCVNSVSGLRIEKRLSYTPWELVLKSKQHSLNSSKRPEDSYCLEDSLETEMTGSYRLYGLRRILNPLWSKLTLKSNFDGALMYALIRKS